MFNIKIQIFIIVMIVFCLLFCFIFVVLENRPRLVKGEEGVLGFVVSGVSGPYESTGFQLELCVSD